MIKNCRNQKSNQAGQGAVEFALVAPILLLLTAGAIDLGNMIYTTHRLNAATREGARLATEANKGNLSPFIWQLRIRNAARQRVQRVMTDSGLPWWDQNATITAAWTSKNIADKNTTPQTSSGCWLGTPGNCVQDYTTVSRPSTNYNFLVVTAAFRVNSFFGNILGAPSINLIARSTGLGATQDMTTGTTTVKDSATGNVVQEITW